MPVEICMKAVGKRLPILPALLLVWLLLPSACTPKIMSIDEARQISLSSRPKTFEPPPRRIEDILKILDHHELSDNEIRRNYLKLLSSPPPSSDSSNFYLQRAKTSLYNMDFRRFQENITKAYEIDKGSNLEILHNMAVAEEGVGNHAKAVDLCAKAIKAEGQLPGYVHPRIWLILIHLRNGNLLEAQRVFEDSRSRYVFSEKEWWVERRLKWVEALLLDANGRHSEADEKWSRVLEMAKRGEGAPQSGWFKSNRPTFNAACSKAGSARPKSNRATSLDT